jgi:hypothetical protein
MKLDPILDEASNVVNQFFLLIRCTYRFVPRMSNYDNENDFIIAPNKAILFEAGLVDAWKL